MFTMPLVGTRRKACTTVCTIMQCLLETQTHGRGCKSWAHLLQREGNLQCKCCATPPAEHHPHEKPHQWKTNPTKQTDGTSSACMCAQLRFCTQKASSSLYIDPRRCKRRHWRRKVIFSPKSVNLVWDARHIVEKPRRRAFI